MKINLYSKHPHSIIDIFLWEVPTLLQSAGIASTTGIAWSPIQPCLEYIECWDINQLTWATCANVLLTSSQFFSSLSSLNLLSYNLKALLLFLSQQILLKFCPCFLVTPGDQELFCSLENILNNVPDLFYYPLPEDSSQRALPWRAERFFWKVQGPDFALCLTHTS